tara:strand:+ start:3778 stop:6276 length:2499 start_codon:yes stop_codon:yes gene_type:complete
MSKKEKEIFTKLNRIFKKDKNLEEIKEWLETLKTYNAVGEKIPGLLNNSKLSLETATEDGGYNLILKWISLNLDKFDGFDFNGIPPSIVAGNISIDLSNISAPQDTDAGTNIRSPKKTFKTEEDVRRWISEPETHPITGLKISPMSTIYADIYEKAYKIIKKIKGNTLQTNRWCYTNFPKNHRLFGNLDFLYHTFIENEKEPKLDRYSTTDVEGALSRNYDLCKLLRRGIENTEEKDNILDTEIELIKNRFNIKQQEGNLSNNYTEILASINLLFKEMIKNLISVSVRPIDFKKLKMSDITKITVCHFSKSALLIINLMENYKFSNGKIIIDYVKEIVNRVPAYLRSVANIPEFNNAINVYDNYKKTYNDYHDLLDPNSGIVNNYEDKKFDIIEDPLDEYFKKYEEKFKKIKSPRFSTLIDLTSFKPIPNNRFLNDKQYKRFQRFKGTMEDMHKKSKQEYEKSLSRYESIKDTTPTAKSPTPPKRPTIKLENGQTYMYGNIEPKHIKDSLVKEFNSEYTKVKSLIDNYNKIKDMGYLELIKQETGKLQTEEAKELIKKHPLLSMNRENINDDLLHDYSGDENKCSESTDILTNEEFDNDNYPLAKLQLMVTLKFLNPNRTECVYAPKLYNLLVTSVNSREPFINPTTRIKYKEEHINQIMDIMKIVINPDIERPIFLKPINDSLLFIDYKPFLTTHTHTSYPTYMHRVNWYSICIYRKFGDETYKIYDLCTIPADIESTGYFATESTDLTSNVMLFRIFKLFNDGRLLHNYVPPYYIIDGPYIKYVKLMIHFNRYKVSEDWLYDKETGAERNKEQFIDMFKRYASEINNFIY